MHYVSDAEKSFKRLCRLNPSIEEDFAKKTLLNNVALRHGVAGYVAGQKDGIRWIASFLSMEYARCAQASRMPERSHSLPRRIPALLMGPKGCGKTTLVDAAATVAGIPHYTVDADSLFRQGYDGLKLSDVIKQANEAACQSEMGVALIHIENLDRVARTSSPGNSSPVWDFINLLEGSYLYEKADRIIVLFSGTFGGIDDVAVRCDESEMSEPRFDGYSAIDESFECSGKSTSASLEIKPAHLARWGMYSGLANCFASICLLDSLGINDLCSIVSGVYGSIEERYAALLRPYGSSFQIDKEASLLLAQQTESHKRGIYGMEDAVGSLVQDSWRTIASNRKCVWKLVVEEGHLHLRCGHQADDVRFDDIAETYGERAPKLLLDTILGTTGQKYERALRDKLHTMRAYAAPFVDENGDGVSTERVVVPETGDRNCANVEVARLAFRAFYCVCQVMPHGAFGNLEVQWGFMRAMQPECDTGAVQRVKAWAKKRYDKSDVSLWETPLAIMDEMIDCYSEEQLVGGIRYALLKIIECVFDENAYFRFAYPARFADEAIAN